MPTTSVHSPTLDPSIREVVARNVHAARQSRGLTLNGLSEMSGIGKATLSGIESQSGNPTIETVWQLAKALEVPFGQLVENASSKRAVLDKGLSATMIDSQSTPQVIETYLLEVAPHTTRKAEAHMAGVKEHVVVLRGQLLVGADDAPMFLRAGQTHSFDADVKHHYRSLDLAATAIVTVVYPELMQSRGNSLDQHRAWPRTDDEWMGLNLQVARQKLEVSQGVDGCRLVFEACDAPKTEALAKLGALAQEDSQFRQSVQAFAMLDSQPSLLILPRPHGVPSVALAPQAGLCLQKATALANRSNSLWRGLEVGEVEALRHDLADSQSVIAALAAEVLTRHGSPSVPARIQPKRKDAAPKRHHLDGGLLFEDRIDVDAYAAYAAYELVHPAYARQSVAIANQIVARCAQGQYRLLDVGTGPGLPLKMLLELVPHLHATAVDPSELAYKHLCQLFRDDARVTPLKESITDLEVAQGQSFDIAVSVGASHHLNTSHFLQATHRALKPGALFIVADEMVAPFSSVAQRSANLIAHHLQYVLDTMPELPPGRLDESELVLVEMIRQQVPLAAYEAHGGDLALAVERCRLLLKHVRNLSLPEPVSHELLAFYRFHFLELEALVAGLDYEVEQKTYPSRFAELARHAGFEVCEHSRLYATHGAGEWDAGTHLFVLKALP